MSQTLSQNFLGEIDYVGYRQEYTEVEGWFVHTQKEKHEPKIEIINKEKNEVVNVEIKRVERQDVHEAFNKASKYLHSGFKFRIRKEVRSILIKIDGELVFDTYLGNFYGLTFDDVVKKRENNIPDIVIVDDFYENPHEVRAFALQQDFIEDARFYKGKRTLNHYSPIWIKKEFERLLGTQIKNFVGLNGVFQYCTAEDPVVYHYDQQEYAAIIYLTPNAPIETGTQTFKSKITGLRRAATNEDEKIFNLSKQEIDTQTFNGDNFLDKTNMELVDSIGNVYNRLIIFNAKLLHAATGYFGNNIENGRLFQIFFFNLERN